MQKLLGPLSKLLSRVSRSPQQPQSSYTWANRSRDCCTHAIRCLEELQYLIPKIRPNLGNKEELARYFQKHLDDAEEALGHAKSCLQFVGVELPQHQSFIRSLESKVRGQRELIPDLKRWAAGVLILDLGHLSGLRDMAISALNAELAALSGELLKAFAHYDVGDTGSMIAPADEPEKNAGSNTTGAERVEPMEPVPPPERSGDTPRPTNTGHRSGAPSDIPETPGDTEAVDAPEGHADGDDQNKETLGHDIVAKPDEVIDKPVLSPDAALVYEMLLKEPSYRGLTGKVIVDRLHDEHKRYTMDESTLSGRIVPQLKPYGIENKPRIGYRIPESHRPQ